MIPTGLLYNLYADTELNLHLVPRSIYDMQSAFYPTVAGKYGVPLDTRHSYTKCTSARSLSPICSDFLSPVHMFA